MWAVYKLNLVVVAPMGKQTCNTTNEVGLLPLVGFSAGFEIILIAHHEKVIAGKATLITLQ
jgi:hypothetical protein